MLISIDERQMQSIGVKPILADTNKLPTVNQNDKVYIIQHPGGMAKHYSHDTIKCVNKPNIEYYADTLAGSSGSPVFVLRESKLLLAALHNIGVPSSLSNSNNSYNKGVLLSEILNHLHTGKGKIIIVSHSLHTNLLADLWTWIKSISLKSPRDLLGCAR